MICSDIQEVIEKEKGHGNFIYPFYEKYCLPNVPLSILNFFNIKTERKLPTEFYENDIETKDINKVILILIDGFGYNQWLSYHNQQDFLNKITQKGVVAPITTIFPSTTASAITSINSGLTPQEHGLPEWYVYFREIDMIISTMHFRPLGSKRNDELLEMGVNPHILFDSETVHQKLINEDIQTFTFLEESLTNSSYSKLIFNGSNMVPAASVSDQIVKLRKHLENVNGLAYYYVYLGGLDAIEHKYGPHTEEYNAELSSLCFLLEKELVNKTNKETAKECLIIVTADHGQLNINPNETLYLNKYPELLDNFQKSQYDNIIQPTGSPRDVFLHIKSDKVEDIQEFLSLELREKATVMKTFDSFKDGLFGTGNPRREFLDRVGNLLILPHENHTVWYKHKNGREFDLLGHHGGLTHEEMLVPFAISNLYNLK